MEKIVVPKEISIKIDEVFECRWSANVHLKLLTIFTDISDLKNHLGTYLKNIYFCSSSTIYKMFFPHFCFNIVISIMFFFQILIQ